MFAALLGSVGLLGLVASPAARAQDAEQTHTVFVSPFQARTPSATTQSALLPGQVNRALSQTPGIELRSIDQIGPVSDMAAHTYASTCPPGQYVGCAFVLGDSAGVDLVVAGAVELVQQRYRVELHILDMERSEDVLAFEAEFAPDDELVFAGAVADLVQAVARGEAGLSHDIRAVADPGQDLENERDRRIAGAQLDSLSKEIGGAESVDEMEDNEVVRQKVTAEDLVEDMRTEGAKPWERVDMTIGEYLRYRNSGMSLMEWRTRARGRQGQLILRAGLGIGMGPVNGAYGAQVARAADNLDEVETWAWQAADDGTGLRYDLSLSYGILPVLEVGVRGGGSTGVFSLQTQTITEGQSATPRQPLETANNTWYVGPQVLAGFAPTSNVRPVVGGQLTYWKGTSVDDHAVIDPDLPRFKAPSVLTVGVLGGVEVRLNKYVDLWAHVPMQVVVGGKTSARRHQGSGYLDNRSSPPALAPFGAGVLAGVQVRLGGGLPEQTGLDAYDYDE